MCQIENKKRKLNTEANNEYKKIKLGSARRVMEEAVDLINEDFNQRSDVTEYEKMTPNKITIESINVNSLIKTKRLLRTKAIVKFWGNDMTVLVDMRIGEKKAKLLVSENYTVFSTNKQFRGVIIQVNKLLDPELVSVDEEDENLVAIIINTGCRKLAIIGIYAPNNDDPTFFKDKITKQLEKNTLKADDLLITGNFNINLSESIGYKHSKSYKSEALRGMIKSWKLKDPIEYKAKQNKIFPLTYIHTTRNESENKETYPLKAARLDGIFMTIDLSKCNIKIGKFYPSDHASVKVSLPDTKETGKKTWRLNSKILQDETMVKRWIKIAKNLTEANETLRGILDNEREITELRYEDVLGRDALKQWNKLTKIIKAMYINESKKNLKTKQNERSLLLSREELRNLEKEELDDILDEINKEEAEKSKIRSEMKNLQMNTSNKRLSKHKASMENQSRKINTIQIGEEKLEDSDKIQEGVQRYYKFQFRCACKNKNRPRPCKICKTNPIEYAKLMDKEFHKKNL